MTRLESWLLHLSNLLVAGTGLVYAWMRYFAHSDDPFAVSNHPLQPLFQHLHVLAAPLLVFAIGMIFQRHVLAGVRTKESPRRKSGLILVALLLPMAASGYLLQTTTSESWRQAWIVVHVAASLLWILAYGGHLAASFATARAKKRALRAAEHREPLEREAVQVGR